MDGRSQIKVHTDEQTPVHCAQSIPRRGTLQRAKHAFGPIGELVREICIPYNTTERIQ